MSCSDPVTCPGGNCIGCKDGQTWCQDPRCEPYCADCSVPPDHDTISGIVVVLIVFCLIALLAAVWLTYGPDFFRPTLITITTN